jgi:hypothetical protein
VTVPGRWSSAASFGAFAAALAVIALTGGQRPCGGGGHRDDHRRAAALAVATVGPEHPADEGNSCRSTLIAREAQVPRDALG